MASPAPPVDAEPGALRRLRHYMAAIGYDEAGVASTLGHGSYGSLLGSGRPAVVDVAAEDARSVLVRLFASASSLPAPVLRAALPIGLVDDLVRCGLLELDGEDARALVRLMPLDGVLVAADLPLDDDGVLPPDHVMSVSMSTKAVADTTVRRPVRTALDVGTGSGVLALLAARHAERVVAVDTNPRALAFARFNAALNGIGNVEPRLGSGFDAVAGERFDLVMSNPPFVVAPEPRYQFRDSGRPGDAFVEELVRRAPDHLEDGGVLQMLGGWVEPVDADPQARLREWWAGSGCGMWVVRTGTQAPREYAESWSYDDAATRETRPRRVDDWVRWLADAGVRSISHGFLFLRRTSVPWFRLDDMPETYLPPSGESLLRVLDANDLLAGLRGPRDLLGLGLRPAPGAALELAAGAAGWAAGALRLTSGFAFTARTDGALLSLLAGADGRRALGDLLADRVGSAEGVADAACAAIWSLVERGLVVPVEISGCRAARTTAGSSQQPPR